MWILLNTLFGALFAAAGMGVEEVECERVNAKGTRSGEATAGGRSCFALLRSALRHEINKTPHAARHWDIVKAKAVRNASTPDRVSTDAHDPHFWPVQSLVLGFWYLRGRDADTLTGFNLNS